MTEQTIVRTPFKNVRNQTDQFLDLFSHRIDSVVRNVNSTSWRPVSRFHQLSDAEIIDCLQSSSRLFRGVAFDNLTSFLVISIPSGSPYQNFQSIDRIRAELDVLSIATLLFEFEQTNYIYVFFSEQVSSNRYASALSYWLELHNFVLSDSTLQVHPNGKAIPLPLQPGFIWLNNKCQALLRREEISFDDALNAFLTQVSDAKNKPDVFDQLLVQTPETQFIYPNSSLSSQKGQIAHNNYQENVAAQFDDIDKTSLGENLSVLSVQVNPCLAEPGFDSLVSNDGVINNQSQTLFQDEQESNLLSPRLIDPPEVAAVENEHASDSVQSSEFMTQIEEEEGIQLLLFPVSLKDLIQPPVIESELNRKQKRGRGKKGSGTERASPDTG